MLGKLIRKCFQPLRIFIYKRLSSNSRIEGQPKRRQPVLLLGKGCISFGKNVFLGYYPSPFFYNGVTYIEARRDSAKIVFGENILVNNNLTIICEGSTIEIGNNVLIGTNVEIIDSDFHGIQHDKRNSGEHKFSPVNIGENVFLGSNVKVLKGVSIGKNSVVANGAVVISSFPSNVIIGGNPAILIKKLYNE